MPVVLPQSHNGSVVRIPTQLNTVGDHIRWKRLGLKMLRKQVAEEIGVDKTSVVNWEANASIPSIEYMPAVIAFLGYNPLLKSEQSGREIGPAPNHSGIANRR